MHTTRNLAFAAAVWAAAWIAMTLLDGWVDLANLAMLVVLGATLSSLWLSAWASTAIAVAAVLAFNWAFVPPRGTLHVDLQQHAVLLGALLLVNMIVAGLMARLRALARTAATQAERARQLVASGERLRDAADPQVELGGLCERLSSAAGVPAAAIALTERPAALDADQPLVSAGEANADQRAGLRLCLREGRAMGPGSGRHEEQPDAYLPMRGQGGCYGAAMLCGLGHPSRAESPGELRAHLQALCDQMGLALQHSIVARETQAAREAAQVQGVRNALLAAISHDYRTPLATILGAASSLESQDDRLDAAQRRQLAHGIAEEAARLARLTDNTLQLARLDAPGVTLRCDWESAEELVGATLRHVRRRDPTRRVRARLEPGLPLLWCDAMLLSQLLDNLVDNALKYSPDEAPVEILVRRIGGQVVLAVRDRGPGIAPGWRERVFTVFQRGAEPAEGLMAQAGSAAAPGRKGAGVGLAVCRAIARAHGGELRLRARAHGGASFECLLPLREPPAQPPAEPVDLPPANEAPR